MPELNKKTEQISTMFDNIAPKYDFLNHFLSFNIDKTWRRKVRKTLAKTNPETILDMATGTGDLAIELAKMSCKKIIGIDISPKMLEVGVKKVEKKKLQEKITLQAGNSQNIDFNESTFDAVTCAFGVRNFENLELGLSEIFRVLKPNGNIAVLEFSKPKNNFFAWIYKFYFHNILPLLGRLVSKSDFAYKYLPQSVEQFPEGEKFLAIMKKVNFKNPVSKPLSFGIATLYTAHK
jgi:demethylmenaquinone methyltransferase/2-methoxy-6-polyprenyl-1,4-benzoquinol methylase